MCIETPAVRVYLSFVCIRQNLTTTCFVFPAYLNLVAGGLSVLHVANPLMYYHCI